MKKGAPRAFSPWRPTAGASSTTVACVVLFSAVLLGQSSGETEVADPAELSSSVTNGPGAAQEAKAFFDELIGGRLRQEHLAGATVSVVEDGRLVFAEGYGYADLESR